MSKSPPASAYLALAVSCLVWGTAFLAVRFSLESFPPPLFMCVRFLVGGGGTLLVAWIIGARLPSRKSFLTTSLNGLLTVGVGVGATVFSLQELPTGLVALFSTTSPFWMIGIEALLPGGERPNLRTLTGMAIGLAGTLVIVAPGAIDQGMGGKVMISFLIVQVGAASYALGYIRERHHDSPAHPVVNAAIQQAAAGVLFVIPALFLTHGPLNLTGRGVAATIYEILFGGVVAFGCYMYAVKRLPVATLSLSNYVITPIALAAGALFYGEKLGWTEVVATVLIAVGIVVVDQASKAKAADTEAVPA
jgi:drug/metabolite transporter (DMT)-like permease